MNSSIKNIIIALVIISIGAFYFSTIREGCPWDGDESMYIQHAKNIVEGRNYDNSNYIYNKKSPEWGPRSYPPVFPLLLTPFYKYFGLNMEIMKAGIVFLFLLFLFVLYLIFSRDLKFYNVIALILIIGFNPYFWRFKNQVLSDIPFLLFLYLTFFIIIKAYFCEKPVFSHAVLIGLMVYLSYGIRAIGAVIIVPLLFYDLIKFRKVTRYFLLSLGVFFILFVLQLLFIKGNLSQLDQLRKFNLLTGFLKNFYIYTRWFSYFCGNEYFSIMRYGLFSIVTLLAVWGYLVRVRNITIFEIFFPLYLLIIISWPIIAGMRYLIPIIPFYIFYALTGFQNIKFINNHHIKRLGFAVLIFLFFVSYFDEYAQEDYGVYKKGVYKKETRLLFDYVENNTDKDDIFMFQKPRVFGLFTDRKASGYYCPADDNELWHYLKDIKADYIILGNIYEKETAFLESFINKYNTNFNKVYSNPDFKIYRITRLK